VADLVEKFVVQASFDSVRQDLERALHETSGSGIGIPSVLN